MSFCNPLWFRAVFLFLLTLGSVMGFSQTALAKPSVAILNLDAKGGITEDEASVITDRLRALILKTNLLNVLERGRMDAILKEQGFQQSAFCDAEACQVQMGRLLGVDGLVIGAVSRLDNLYTLSVRILDVERGIILREEYEDCRCSLSEVLTRVTPRMAKKVLNQPVSQTSQNVSPGFQFPSLVSSPPPAASVRIQNDFAVTSFVGRGIQGFKNGDRFSSFFNQPTALLNLGDGNLLVVDAGNHKIRKVSAAQQVFSFSGRDKDIFNRMLGVDPSGRAPHQIAYASPQSMVSYGNHFMVVDTLHHTIQVIAKNGSLITSIGSGEKGYRNGHENQARFNSPYGMAIDRQGNIYVADTYNHSIRKVTLTGQVSTLAGNGERGLADGMGRQARFSLPGAIAYSASDNVLYVSDSENHRICKVSLNGKVTTVAGAGAPGFQDGSGTQARFHSPRGLALDKQGNIYVADVNNHSIRKISPQGQVTTLSGTGYAGFQNGTNDSVRYNYPVGLLLIDDYLLVADRNNHQIRKIELKY